jgi:hypothetical protein
VELEQHRLEFCRALKIEYFISQQGSSSKGGRGEGSDYRIAGSGRLRFHVLVLTIPSLGTRDYVTASFLVNILCTVQGIAGNKKGEFWVEAQFLSKSHTKMV